jgi:uncharacterized membrane protein
VRVEFPAQYTPIPYAPQAIACLIGDWTASRPLVTFYMGRLLNLGVFVLSLALAIKRNPQLGWIAGIVALLPMSLYMAASFSPDAFTMAVSFYLTSTLLSAINASESVSKGSIATIFVLSTVLALCKPPYFLLAALFIAIPKSRFGVGRQKILYIAGLTVCLAAAALLSTATVSRNFYPMRRDAQIDPRAQMVYVGENPSRFLRIVSQDYLEHGREYARHFVGHLGWLDVPLPMAIIILDWLLLISVALSTSGGPLLPSHRLLACAILLLCLLVISLSQYIAWTPVRASRIEGIQGRYFLPLGPLALALLRVRHRDATLSITAGLVVLTIAVLSNCVALWTVAQRYY